jgi:glycosyltransferase involved in cell wall biosynthesis
VIAFLVFIVCIAVQAFYAGCIGTGRGSRISLKQGQERTSAFVTVLICAHNEAENLRKNLPAILEQLYTDSKGQRHFNVLVVDDGSDDGTADVLAEMARRYEHLEVVRITNKQKAGKKAALKEGVRRSVGKWLLLTDADCVPASDQWLALMVQPLAAGKKIVAGYGGYFSKPGLFNAFIRWETLHTWLQYSSYIMMGRPYMAVGRNMACDSELLSWAMNEPLWEVLPSGDDDLFVQIAGSKVNCAVVSDSRAFTYSPAKETWKEWVAQKQRHLSTGKYYRLGTKVALGLYGASHAGMWVAFVFCLFTFAAPAVIVLMVSRCLYVWFKWYLGARRVKEAGSVFLYPLFDIGWMMYNFAFLPYITWKNKTSWK